jgi:hypothetical protein
MAIEASFLPYMRGSIAARDNAAKTENMRNGTAGPRMLLGVRSGLAQITRATNKHRKLLN